MSIFRNGHWTQRTISKFILEALSLWWKGAAIITNCTQHYHNANTDHRVITGKSNTPSCGKCVHDIALIPNSTNAEDWARCFVTAFLPKEKNSLQVRCVDLQASPDQNPHGPLPNPGPSKSCSILRLSLPKWPIAATLSAPTKASLSPPRWTFHSQAFSELSFDKE